MYLGDDDTYYGSPKIENGVITGYVGKNGPFQKKEFNFWKEFGEGSIIGSVDGILGNYVHDQFMKTKHEVIRVPTLGVASSIDRFVYPSYLDKTIANLSKTAGVVSLGITGFNIFQKYTGADRYWAAALTVALAQVQPLVEQ
ncbi:hypothetical protein [Paenibacillus yanchengensis]|uniref:Uncharacterized protein n=1 Tax=Paenibacillus yanchengensis TaxID=2035833 RepID=A0ABW4YI60_9BACL